MHRPWPAESGLHQVDQHSEPTGCECGLKDFTILSSGMSHIFISPPDDARRIFAAILFLRNPQFHPGPVFFTYFLHPFAFDIAAIFFSFPRLTMMLCKLTNYPLTTSCTSAGNSRPLLRFEVKMGATSSSLVESNMLHDVEGCWTKFSFHQTSSSTTGSPSCMSVKIKTFVWPL